MYFIHDLRYTAAELGYGSGQDPDPNKARPFQCWGYSSVAEHSTADREVTGSTPVAP